MAVEAAVVHVRSDTDGFEGEWTITVRRSESSPAYRSIAIPFPDIRHVPDDVRDALQEWLDSEVVS